MEKDNRGDDIVLLFDTYTTASRDLYTSFKTAGYQVQAVVMNDDGFLPDDVMSVYGEFLGQFTEAEGCPGRPIYFNQVKTPPYWSLNGNNTKGEIHNMEVLRADIFYTEPKHKRLVKAVDWKSDKGVVRCTDHYNRYGALYARTTFNAKQQKVNKSFFDAKGREIIVENYVTGDIILNDGDVVRIFNNKTEFTAYLLKQKGFDKKRIFFNSLGAPLFVSNYLEQSAPGVKEDVVFWQEPTGAEIPGNMRTIFNGSSKRASRVVVQNHDSYQKLIGLGAPKDKTSELGFIYSFRRSNHHKRGILICTNTENVEKINELMQALPQFTFHITALTEMSPKLMSVERYDNARLYPNVRMNKLDELFGDCDYFLDINHEGEICDATRRAFLNNMLILAFDSTAHGRAYTAQENIFAPANYMGMANVIRKLEATHPDMDIRLENQRKWALTAQPEDYVF